MQGAKPKVARPVDVAHPPTWKNQLNITGQVYDAAGSMTNDGSHPYTYDIENRLLTAGGWSYKYDGDGKRIRKCNSCSVSTGGTLYWYGIDGAPMIESNLTGTLSYEYIFFNGKRIARRDNTSNPPSYYFSDHLGSTSVVVGSGGAIKDESDYFPIGGEIVISNTLPQNYKFTGKERDTETGFDYFGARYYGSNMGRFTSPDPGPYVWNDPQTLNRYAYTRNNPLKYIDPTGKYFVVAAQDQKFYQKALTELYRRPGGRELVNSLANSNRPVLLDRYSLDTANTGRAAVTTGLAVSGQPGVAGAHVTVGTDADLMAGAKMAPGKVSPGITTGHELEHANDGITQGQTSLQQGAAAMAAGDAPSSPGANNTVGGTAQSRAEEIMGEKTDMNSKDAGAAVQDILKSGHEQWQNDTNKSSICSQNQGACH